MKQMLNLSQQYNPYMFMAKMVKWVERWFNTRYGWFLTNGNKMIG